MIKVNFRNRATIITAILMVFSGMCCFANELDFDPFGTVTGDANTSAELVKEGPIIPQVQFNNNDISMAFQIISDLTGWSIFPTGQVAKARISLWANNISAQELLDIVVNLTGFTYHHQGNIVTVMTYDEYIQFHGLAREVIELTYADAASVASVIKPFMSKRGVNIVHKQTNTIVLYETAANLEFIVGIIERLVQTCLSSVSKIIFSNRSNNSGK
ncbi:MAG: secretin N-terminal domain-containing protein [Planctomycetota bacterium]|jgi:type II secretory pathway component GspD/PulD (secretin)